MRDLPTRSLRTASRRILSAPIARAPAASAPTAKAPTATAPILWALCVCTAVSLAPIPLPPSWCRTIAAPGDLCLTDYLCTLRRAATNRRCAMVRHAVLALAILLAALVAAQGVQAHGRGLVPMPPVVQPVKPHPGNRPPFHHNGFRGRSFIPYWGYGVYAQPVTYVTYVPYEPAPV